MIGHDKNPLLSDSWWAGGSFQKVSCGCITEFSVDTKKKKKKRRFKEPGNESTCNEGDLGSIPGLGRSPREEKGYPLQYSGLENFMDCIVHVFTKSWT